MKRILAKGAVLAVVATTLFAGCYGHVRGVGPGVYVGADFPIIDIEPPAPQIEDYGVAPYADAFWVEGYWYWEAGAYRWRPGHWEHRRPGQRWYPHRWHRESNGWRFQGGYWGSSRY